MNLGLRGKILLLSAFMCAVSFSIGGVSYYFSNRTGSLYAEIVESDVPGLRALNRMLLSVRLARIELLQAIMPGSTKEQAAESIASINEQWKSYDADEEVYLKTNMDEEEKALHAIFHTHTNVVRAHYKTIIDLYNKNPDENSAERKEAIKIAMGILIEDSNQLRIDTRNLIQLSSKNIDENSINAKESKTNGAAISGLITILGSLVGFVIAFLFSTQIAKKIGVVVNLISESSNQVASASNQISSSSQQLSQATTEQAASLEETAASLEEISSMINKSSDSAKTTESSSTESQQTAMEGQKSVEQMLTSIDEISQSNEAIMSQVNRSNEEMTEIVRVIQEIGEKTKVINEIVFQTKLLSFNASVEAARAGEHGKGFAVVAEEVGNLAQMSGNAAKEITTMLETSIVKVDNIVKNTKTQVEGLVQQGKQKVESGVEVAKNCSSSLDAIVQNTSRVSDLAQEISTASKEQAQGIAQINKAMSQLDTVTQQNSATSQESAAAAEELSSQAESLKAAVEDLVTIVQGKNGSVQTISSAPVKVSKKQMPPIERPSSRISKGSNVVHIKPHATVASQAAVMQMAAGSDYVPRNNDSGFQD